MSCPFLKLALRATYRRSKGCGGAADYSADRAHHYPWMGGAWARTPISRISPKVILVWRSVMPRVYLALLYSPVILYLG